MADIEAIAHALAESRYRFLTDMQIGTIRRLHKATRDEVRTAAIMADRIRRHRQLGEGRNSFSVSGLVEAEAPIVLRDETKATNRRRRR